MSHTPGPWHRSEIGDATYIIGHPNWPCARNGQEGEWEIATLDDLLGEHADEVKANAKLLSASPDLLAALSLTRMSLGWQYMSAETRAVIDAALTKAGA